MKINVKRTLVMVLCVTVIAAMLVATAITASQKNDSFSDNVVITSLADLYDGDEAKAREQLQTLYESGLVDENGQMVSLDVCENGKSVDLRTVAMRIAMGESVGTLTAPKSLPSKSLSWK